MNQTSEPSGGGLCVPLPAPEVRDLPPQTRPFWKLAGPGAILVGLSIGAGELVIWPQIVARYGASMVWAAVVGVFLQLWINFEVGRWTIATGETVFTGYARVWRGFAPLFILLTIAGWLAPGWARVSGSALQALLVGPESSLSNTFWTALTFLGVALLLFGPKLIYNTVEKTISALVVIIVVGLVIVAAAVGKPEHWGELGNGILGVGNVAPGFSVKELFSALVFAGAGGTANLFYTFYLRDKQLGMGAHVPQLINPLRGRTEAADAVGFTYAETPENQRNFQAWFRYVRLDQALFFWLLNTFTILLFIFASLAALHHHEPPIVPQSGRLVFDQAAILGQMWGAFGEKLFLIIGLATLFSTQLALVDGVSRSLADILHTNLRIARRRSLSWWYGIIAAAWMVTGVWITYILEKFKVTDLGFLFNAGYMGGFAMAVYVPLQLYLNHRYLPRSARPGVVCTVMMSLCAVIYCGFAVACVLWETGVLKG